MQYYSINGKVIDAENAKIHVSDLAFLRAYSAFDFFRVLCGKAVFLDEHIKGC